MPKKILFIILLITLIITHILCLLFGMKKLNLSIEQISSESLEQTLNKIANDFYLFENDNLNSNLVEVQKDSKGQISTMKYSMEEVYHLASKIEQHLSKRFLEEEQISLIPYQLNNKVSSKKQGILLLIPLGMITQSPMLNNFGPKIPIVIHFMDTFLTQVQTKITNYGMNNALMEIILHIKMKYEIVGLKKNIKEEIEYSYLIDSRIIQGNVPNWYTGTYEKRSSFYEIQKSDGIDNLQLKE